MALYSRANNGQNNVVRSVANNGAKINWQRREDKRADLQYGRDRNGAVDKIRRTTYLLLCMFGCIVAPQ